MDSRYLSDEDFFAVYGKVPRLNVDIVMRSPEGILLALRTIEPHPGTWHLIGGTVYKNEKIVDAVARVAERETGLKVVVVKCLGYMEFPHEMRSGNDIHTISIVIEVVPESGELKHDADAKELKYFKTLPDNMISQHAECIKHSGIEL